MMNIEKIVEKLEENGVAQVGFSNVSAELPDRYKHLPYAVTLVYKLSNAVLNEVVTMPTYSYFHHYRHVNAFLDSQTLWLSTMIEREGFLAMPVGASQSVNDGDDKYTGIFQHKTGAVKAGLGWIGKSALFVSPKYGPRVRLATVLTNMPLPVEQVEVINRCGTCQICANACPAMAISGKNYEIGDKRETIFDATACSEHMKKAYKHIGRGAVCGVCVSSCPYGKK